MIILIVDDEKLMVKGLSASLKKDGFDVLAAYDGKEALETLQKNKVDLVLLDIMLPGIDGMTLLRKIRDTLNVPVIMLTARDDYADMVMGLELGADDYVTKPFQTRVLIARIHSLLRRTGMTQAAANPVSLSASMGSIAPGGSQPQSIMDDGTLRIDSGRRTVLKNGMEIELTAKEFDILWILAWHKGMVLSRDKIFELVWNEPDCDTRTVDVHISKLREKLEDEPGTPAYIRTKWGVGYYFRKAGL